jgi:hypothetical protein
MADTSHNWICKRCTGRGQHFLTCPVLQLPAAASDEEER